jgi:FKBP-type peptidyl-prolyl cis-trans isomerase
MNDQYVWLLSVHFTGKRLDGTWFASTREDGVPLTFILGQGITVHPEFTF